MIFWMWFPSDRVVLGCVKRLLRRVMKWMTPLRHDPTNKKHCIRHKTHSNTFVLGGLPILQLLYWRSYRRKLPRQPVPSVWLVMTQRVVTYETLCSWRRADTVTVDTSLSTPASRVGRPAADKLPRRRKFSQCARVCARACVCVRQKFRCAPADWPVRHRIGNM